MGIQAADGRQWPWPWFGKGIITRSDDSPYRIVQPYGRHKAQESTVVSEHQTAADAFVEIDSARITDGPNRCAERCDRADRGGRG